MSNHFHVLVRVPLEVLEKLSDHQLLKRCEYLYGEDEIAMYAVGESFRKS